MPIKQMRGRQVIQQESIHSFILETYIKQLSSLFSPPTSHGTGCHHIPSALIKNCSTPSILPSAGCMIVPRRQMKAPLDYQMIKATDQGTSPPPADDSPHLAIAEMFS